MCVPAPSGRSTSTTRATSAGRAFAISSSRCGGSLATDSVSSWINAGQTPWVCWKRVPGAGQPGSWRSIERDPTTQCS